VAAVRVAVTVAVTPVPVVEMGLNPTLTPAGNAPTLKATDPANPPVRVMVMVVAPLLPWATVRLVGFADSEKSGTAVGFTVRVIATECESDPLVPVTVTLEVPVAAVPDTVRMRPALVPVVVTGLNAALTPEGSPLALSATDPANPPVRAIVMVLEPLLPCVTIRLDGAAVSEKSTGGEDPPAWHVIAGIAFAPVTLPLKPTPPYDPPAGRAPL
jgi:hypothetical protein